MAGFVLLFVFAEIPVVAEALFMDERRVVAAQINVVIRRERAPSRIAHEHAAREPDVIGPRRVVVKSELQEGLTVGRRVERHLREDVVDVDRFEGLLQPAIR